MRPVAIIQARLNSTRFPRKVLAPLTGHTVLYEVVRRVRQAVADVMVAVPIGEGGGYYNNDLIAYCESNNIWVTAPPVADADVLSRYYEVASALKADPIIRVTADCPLVSPDVIRELLAIYEKGVSDYVGVSTVAVKSQWTQRGLIKMPVGGDYFPDGLDAEVFSYAALRRAWVEALKPTQREHVTPYIWTNSHIFRCSLLWDRLAAGHQHRLTVDTPQDLAMLEKLLTACGPDVLWPDAVRWLDEHPEVAELNQGVAGTDYGAIH